MVASRASVVVRPSRPLRGEDKLRAALDGSGVEVAGRICLDVGASAGGFTRVLVEGGASKVIAVDAGYGQLRGSLRAHSRVLNLERTNLSELGSALPRCWDIDVVTLDLSYLSVAVAVPQLEAVRLSPTADLIALVKPMFELGLATPPVDEPTLRRAVEQAVHGVERDGRWVLEGTMSSPVRGARGAREWLLHARRTAGSSGGDLAMTRWGMPLNVPDELAANAGKSATHRAWLEGLPAAVRELERRWSLTLGPPFDGPEVSAAWVAPAQCADGTRAVLKIGLPHMEADHEVDGLRFWDGDPTVRLLDANDALGAILLERCDPGTHLRSIPEVEQDVVLAGLLRRLWRMPSAPHPFRRLAEMVASWGAETIVDEKRWPDPGLVREGLRLFDELSRAGAADEVLLSTDLHAGNVLAAQREPWLVIDPKPFVGDPAYDATQHLWNCESRMREAPFATIDGFADLLEVDAERVRLWTFARAAAEPRDEWDEETMDPGPSARAVGSDRWRAGRNSITGRTGCSTGASGGLLRSTDGGRQRTSGRCATACCEEPSSDQGTGSWTSVPGLDCSPLGRCRRLGTPVSSSGWTFQRTTSASVGGAWRIRRADSRWCEPTRLPSPSPTPASMPSRRGRSWPT